MEAAQQRDPAKVYGAIAHYLANKATVDAYLVGQDQKWAEGKAKSESVPTNLRERLLRAREQIESTRLP